MVRCGVPYEKKTKRHMTRTCGSISVRSVLAGGGLVEKEEEEEVEKEGGVSIRAPACRG
jgi:hypothetical protein